MPRPAPDLPPHDAILDTPLGLLGIAAGETLLAIEFIGEFPGGPRPPGLKAAARTSSPHSPPRTSLAREAARQLQAYFRDARFRFDLPLAPATTEFQGRVRRALLRLPPGRVLTYGELARRLGSAPRAVGQACGANPLPIVIPCHRVVGARGLGGYSGARCGTSLDPKRWLLDHERVIPGGRAGGDG